MNSHPILLFHIYIDSLSAHMYSCRAASSLFKLILRLAHQEPKLMGVSSTSTHYDRTSITFRMVYTSVDSNRPRTHSRSGLHCQQANPHIWIPSIIRTVPVLWHSCQCCPQKLSVRHCGIFTAFSRPFCHRLEHHIPSDNIAGLFFPFEEPRTDQTASIQRNRWKR